MTNLDQALCDCVVLLEEMAAPYVVMGGLAVRVYGIPRPTYDVDFTVALVPRRLPEFYQRLEKLGYAVPDAYLRGWVDRVAGMPVVKARLYLAERGVDVDFFLAESPFQEELLARRRREQIDDLVVWLVTPEDLILLKLLASRPRDLADIGDVLFTQGQLDERYMRQWARELGVLDELESVLAAS